MAKRRNHDAAFKARFDFNLKPPVRKKRMLPPSWAFA